MSNPNHPMEDRFRTILFPLALFYWGVIFWRNFFYQVRFFITRRLPCKVISVGNITTGGTGKTPMVIALARLLQEQGKRVAVVSRGYGRSTSGTVLVTNGTSAPESWQSCGDEPYLMATSLSGVPIVVDEVRFRGGSFLIQKFNPDFIILDDAFQHRAIERDLDIVLINSGDRRQDHKLLPYGMFREPWYHLRRAHMVFLTKTNLGSPRPFLKKKLGQLPIPWYQSTFQPDLILPGLQGSEYPLADIRDKKIMALSGVADPSGFKQTIQKTKARTVGELVFPDHHVYTSDDLRTIQREFQQTGAELIICTEKDLLKFEALNADLPLFAIRIMFTLDQKGLRALLQRFTEMSS